MGSFYYKKLSHPLQMTLRTIEGQYLGSFPCHTLCDDGVLIEGKVDTILDSLRLLDSYLLILEIAVPHHRSIRAAARLSLHNLTRQYQSSRAFLRFVRMNFDCKQRYTDLLYSMTASNFA